jgi:asparagine synthase (glutamine-hydrolysing)
MIRDSVGLGHRRLSIIDLATGAQPMTNEDGNVWITYNGELYNYQELRKELIAKGHGFRSVSDTETIIHAYEEWGDACVERFRGMFAFGIADYRKRRVFLARDQLGIKPLYYLVQAGHFAFASELQALRCIPGQPFTIDTKALDEYLWLQYIPAPRTIFREVQKLPPAHRMAITFDGRVTGPEEYWRVEWRPDRKRREEEWVEALDDVLRDSVRAHLVADVPFGAFLSGGVDSSAVVAYMAQIMDRPVKTFSIGFEEAEYSELPFAKQASERWGTEHHVEIVKPDALDVLPRLVSHYGEPFGDSSAIPTFYVSQMARKHVPMVLSGDGGDESFAGYDSYRYWMRGFDHDGAARWKNLLRPIGHALNPDRYPLRCPTLDAWLSFINYMPTDLRQQLWRPEYRPVLPPVLETFKKEFKRVRKYQLCSKVQYMDLKTYLPFDILTKVDVASMMHGLEVRTPLVDVRVVEFASTIPQNLLIRKNGAGEWEGKLLLKKVMQKYYPSEFLHRKKMGFAVPVRKWFSSGGALRPMVQERLTGQNSVLNEFFNLEIRQAIVANGVSHQMWLLLFLDEWLRQNRANLA